VILAVGRRIVCSVTVAVPLALISFAIADHEMTPNVIRYLIAPGYVLSLRLSLGGSSFSESISRDVCFALTANTAYYGLLVFLVLWSVARRHASSK
jgi:hypothetical protein